MAATRALVALNLSNLVSCPISATRPVDANSGVPIAKWRTNVAFGAQLAMVFISGDTDATITPIAGADGVELWQLINGKWWLSGELRDDRTVTVKAAAAGGGQIALGFMQELTVVAVADRLLVVGTVSAGAAVAEFVPLESYQ